jgi:predicted transposase YbfD/YdcC
MTASVASSAFSIRKKWLASSRASGTPCGRLSGSKRKAVTLKGCIVTAEALHCHPAMAEAVRARGGHYALRLKANHGPLFACVEKAFAEADATGALSFHEQSESGHGRRERRRASVIAVPSAAPAFPNLVAFGRIESERTANVRTGAKVHYAALSKALNPGRLLKIMRTHWSVENQLHWPLDVVFHQDDARTRKNYAPQNLAVLRRIALDILRTHPDNKSVARKMNLAAGRKEFFFELFAHMR